MAVIGAQETGQGSGPLNGWLNELEELHTREVTKLGFAHFKQRKQGNRQASVVQGGRDFPYIRVGGGSEKPSMTPATGAGAPGRWHPRRSATAWYQARAMGRGSLLPQQMGRQGGPREEPHQDRRSTGNGQVRPLALGLHAQVSPHLLKGDLQLPAQHKPFQTDLRRVRRRIGAEQLGSEFALWVPNQDPAQGHRRLPERHQTAVCEVTQRAGSAVVPGCRHGGP